MEWLRKLHLINKFGYTESKITSCQNEDLKCVFVVVLLFFFYLLFKPQITLGRKALDSRLHSADMHILGGE